MPAAVSMSALSGGGVGEGLRQTRCGELIESSHPIRTTTAAGSRSTIGPNDDVGRDERVLKLTLKALGICVAGWIAGVILILLGFEFIGIVVGGISIPVALCYWVVADAR